MGLDMYIFITKEVPEAAVDFPKPEVAAEFYYWRKHPNLHGWMQALYWKKGGKDRNFNMTPVVLTAEDLDRLQADIQATRLPHTSGFFFGADDGTELEKLNDLEFVERARAVIGMGLTVFYVAWW